MIGVAYLEEVLRWLPSPSSSGSEGDANSHLAEGKVTKAY